MNGIQNESKINNWLYSRLILLMFLFLFLFFVSSLYNNCIIHTTISMLLFFMCGCVYTFFTSSAHSAHNCVSWFCIFFFSFVLSFYWFVFHFFLPFCCCWLNFYSQTVWLCMRYKSCMRACTIICIFWFNQQSFSFEFIQVFSL